MPLRPEIWPNFYVQFSSPLARVVWVSTEYMVHLAEVSALTVSLLYKFGPSPSFFTLYYPFLWPSLASLASPLRLQPSQHRLASPSLAQPLSCKSWSRKPNRPPLVTGWGKGSSLLPLLRVACFCFWRWLYDYNFWDFGSCKSLC